jgi:hypothetical protein
MVAIESGLLAAILAVELAQVGYMHRTGRRSYVNRLYLRALLEDHADMDPEDVEPGEAPLPPRGEP